VLLAICHGAQSRFKCRLPIYKGSAMKMQMCARSFVAALVGVLIFIGSAMAENPKESCDTTQKAMDIVRGKSEKIIFRGLSIKGHLVTIYLASSGTFTAVIHFPGGKSCLVDFGASGELMGGINERS